MFKCYFVGDGDPRPEIGGNGPVTLQRVTEALDGCVAAARRAKPAFDPAFYDYKAALREAFPGTMIEIVPGGSFLDRITLTGHDERTAVYAAVNTGL